MKKLIPLLIPFLLSAADFDTAEHLFTQGDFVSCSQLIAALQDSRNAEKLTAEQKKKLLAMQEYLLGNDPGEIQKIVKEAQKTASHQGWRNDDLLKHASQLIRRAEYWKQRGIPEYQELSDAAAKLLEQAGDNGSSDIAIRLVILQTKNFNLNGEFQEPLRRIRQLLRLYYPDWNRNGRKRLSSAAVRILILAGEQYAGIGNRSNHEQEKIKAFAETAKYYLAALGNLRREQPESQELCDRLSYCQETLRLLGYRLRLPAKIKARKSSAAGLIDDMLKARRFQDVMLALQNNPDSAMRLRYLVALSASGETDKMMRLFNASDMKIEEPLLLLQIVRNCLAARKKNEAILLLQRFLKEFPDTPDTVIVTRQYAELLIGEKRFSEAAAALLGVVGQLRNPKAEEQARFRAVQCFYLAKKWDECIKNLELLPSTPERMLLKAQVQIQRKNNGEAMRLLQTYLKEKRLSESDRVNGRKLLISCAMKTDCGRAAVACRDFILDYPERPESFDYAKHLLELYLETGAGENDFMELGNWTALHRLENRETVPLLLQCVAHLKKSSDKEKLLKKLLARKDFPPAELLTLLDKLPSDSLRREFLKKFQKPFKNTPDICALYLKSAELDRKAGKYKEALKSCKILLNRKEVYQYRRVREMQARLYSDLHQEDNARRCYQELLLTELPPKEKRKILLSLAESWERSGEWRKAMAQAWSGVPLSGKTEPQEDDKKHIEQLLRLIIRNAEKADSREDKLEAEELLKEFPALGKLIR